MLRISLCPVLRAPASWGLAQEDVTGYLPRITGSNSRPHPHVNNLSRVTQLRERMETYLGVDDIFHRCPQRRFLCAWGTLGRENTKGAELKGRKLSHWQPAYSKVGDETPCGDFYQLPERIWQSHPRETEALI